MTDPGRPPLCYLDAELARLRKAYPSYRIWFVPHADGRVVWCAQPLPLLNCRSPAELAEEITRAMSERP
jgi:hypothetical protein